MDMNIEKRMKQKRENMVNVENWCGQWMGNLWLGGWIYGILGLILLIGAIVLVYMWIWKLLQNKKK